MALVLPPTVELAQLPTPLEKLDRASEQLGVELFIKRDDMTGLGLSGNKVRKLEFLIADALANDAQTLITCGGAQSNHARATAVAAAQLGLRSLLFLRNAADAPVAGNLALGHLVGAEIRSITRTQYQQRDALMMAATIEMATNGHRAYPIPEGGSNGLGSLGYLQCVREIVEDEDYGAGFDVIACAVGSGGTLAGLIAGQTHFDVSAKLIGYAVCDDREYFCKKIDEILASMHVSFGLALRTCDDRAVVDDRYIGDGYGITQPEAIEQIRWLARTEGIFLDPVYSSKAFLGLISAIKTGEIKQGDRVLFIHTGGVFGLFRGDEAALAGA